MNKLLTLCVALGLTSSLAFAQTDTRKTAEELDNKLTKTGEMKEGWTKGGLLTINLNHTSNDAWQGASDKYALAINGSLNYFAYRKWNKNLWKNDLLMAYGVLRSSSTEDLFRKNDDRLMFSSMFARQINKKLYYAASLDAFTQIAPGYDYNTVVKTDSATGDKSYLLNSSFLTPGNIRLGVGILYQPRTNFSVYLSPLTTNIYTKIHKDFRNVDFNGVEAGKSINFGLGAMMRADYFTTINKTLTYKTRFVAFTDYLDRPFDKIDLDWINSILFSGNKYITVKLDVNFRYYEQQIAKLQVLEMLGIGFAYKF